MFVEGENRGLTQFFLGGIRGMLNSSSILQRPDSNHADVQAAPVSSTTPAHAMFQGASNTSIGHATFNMYGSGANMAPVSHSLETSSPPSSSSGSSSPSLEAQSPTGTPIIEIDIPSSCVNDPFPAPQTGPEIYVHCLKNQNRGYPLWIPSPSLSLPASYRSSGVTVGDVGIITPEGGFSFFFNVLHGATHPINAEMILPEYFAPYIPHRSTRILVLKESSAMNYLADRSITRIDCGGDRLKTVLKTSAKQAAVLMMPEPVYLSRLPGLNLFRRYVNKHLESWYRFIRGDLGCDVENGDLRVVYACRKTAGFGIATVFNESMDSTTELTFSIDETWTEIVGCRYRWHHRGSAEVKVGPSVDETADIRELEPSGDADVNQCLFLSTLDFTLSDDQWARVASDDSVAFSAHSPTTQATAHSVTSRALHHIDTVSSTTNPEVQSNTVSTSVSRTGRISSTSFKNSLFHPSDVLARFLLSKVPGANSVSICSEDWGPFMTDEVNDVTSFIRSVLCANDVCEEDGMLYLNARSLFTTTSREIFSQEYAYFLDLLEKELSDLHGRNNVHINTPLLHHAIVYLRSDHEDVFRPNRVDSALQVGAHLQQSSISTFAPGNPEVSILIGVFDPHQHINNQTTVRVTISDNGAFKTEIIRSNAYSPVHVLIVDGVNENGVNLNLEWFNVRTDKKAFRSLMAFHTSWCLRVGKTHVRDANSSPLASSSIRVVNSSALQSLTILAAKLCRLVLRSVDLNPTLTVISHRIPTSLDPVTDQVLRDFSKIPPSRPLALSSLRDMTNPTKFPNLTLLVAVAIWDSPEKQLTLNEIYAAIETRYPILQGYSHNAWQRSVSRRLSRGAIFFRVPNQMERHIRGGAWALDISKVFEANTFRKRGEKYEDEDFAALIGNIKQPNQRVKLLTPYHSDDRPTVTGDITQDRVALEEDIYEDTIEDSVPDDGITVARRNTFDNGSLPLQPGLAEPIPDCGTRLPNDHPDITLMKHHYQPRLALQASGTSHISSTASSNASKPSSFMPMSVSHQPPTPSARTWIEPPWSGWIETTGDALLILEAARRGLIPRVSRRLVESERKMIISGSVFVFDEDESGIKRWFDGFFWSPSRILGNFLLYRETDKRGAGHRSARTKQLLMQREATASSATVGGLHIENQNQGLSRPKTDNSGLSVDKQRKRALIGSLTNSYKFKPDGLMKKTFSVTINGVAQHLISYYKIVDVESGRLRSPSSLPEFAALDISPEYLDKTHFRNPPKIVIVDGIPRYCGESDDIEGNGSLSIAYHSGINVDQGVGGIAKTILDGPVLSTRRQQFIPDHLNRVSGHIGPSTLYDPYGSLPQQKKSREYNQTSEAPTGLKGPGAKRSASTRYDSDESLPQQKRLRKKTRNSAPPTGLEESYCSTSMSTSDYQPHGMYQYPQHQQPHSEAYEQAVLQQQQQQHQSLQQHLQEHSQFTQQRQMTQYQRHQQPVTISYTPPPSQFSPFYSIPPSAMLEHPPLPPPGAAGQPPHTYGQYMSPFGPALYWSVPNIPTTAMATSPMSTSSDSPSPTLWFQNETAVGTNNNEANVDTNTTNTRNESLVLHSDASQKPPGQVPRRESPVRQHHHPHASTASGSTAQLSNSTATTPSLSAGNANIGAGSSQSPSSNYFDGYGNAARRMMHMGMSIGPAAMPATDMSPMSFGPGSGPYQRAPPPPLPAVYVGHIPQPPPGAGVDMGPGMSGSYGQPSGMSVPSAKGAGQTGSTGGEAVAGKEQGRTQSIGPTSSGGAGHSAGATASYGGGKGAGAGTSGGRMVES